ncbi:MAG TPA: tryptophan synthase subunit alpha, partial [Pyrinomonadaceae bacterium]|nr:tryptophan synthase subunit alpha [Pyrinomonadaceae bacterium]
MSRIAERFQTLKKDGRKGFVPFVTAGDPNLETSLEIVLRLAELGADVIELGVPFSDPMADGPTIQRSSQRALDNGVSLADVLELAREARTKTDTPIILFSYLNPLLRFGFSSVISHAVDVGLDGILITDAVNEEAAEYSDLLGDAGMDLISLIAPTTTDERLEKITQRSSGFLYAVSRAGVTGAREAMTTDAEQLVVRARQFTDLPIAVGFGISKSDQIADVWRYADAAVVGSAIVSEIGNAAPGSTVAAVEAFVSGLLPKFAKSG